MDLWAVNIFMVVYNILCFFSNLLFMWAFRGQNFHNLTSQYIISNRFKNNILQNHFRR